MVHKDLLYQGFGRIPLNALYEQLRSLEIAKSGSAVYSNNKTGFFFWEKQERSKRTTSLN